MLPVSSFFQPIHLITVRAKCDNQFIESLNFAFKIHFLGQGYAEDYYLDAKSQCAGGRGSCPDRNIRKGKVIQLKKRIKINVLIYFQIILLS